MIAEGAVAIIALERFLRIILKANGEPTFHIDKKGKQCEDTLPNLLQKAASKRLKLIDLQAAWLAAGGAPPAPSLQAIIDDLSGRRNVVLHADYEKAARLSGHATVAGFFGNFAGYTEAVDALVTQIDREPGKPHPRP
jgi:beta-phosphoglucomutase-like phosphatase (HAD superfamily)